LLSLRFLGNPHNWWAPRDKPFIENFFPLLFHPSLPQVFIGFFSSETILFLGIRPQQPFFKDFSLFSSLFPSPLRSPRGPLWICRLRSVCSPPPFEENQERGLAGRPSFEFFLVLPLPPFYPRPNRNPTNYHAGVRSLQPPHLPHVFSIFRGCSFLLFLSSFHPLRLFPLRPMANRSIFYFARPLCENTILSHFFSLEILLVPPPLPPLNLPFIYYSIPPLCHPHILKFSVILPERCFLRRHSHSPLLASFWIAFPSFPPPFVLLFA